jgi:acyl-CoA synthetase (NDP forming)
VNRTELLGIALQVSAHQCEILIDPYEEASAVELLAITTAHDHEGFPVLGPDGIEQLGAVGTAALPVGPDEGNRAGIFVLLGEGHSFGQ